MEFNCPKCNALYSISDHRVRGGSGTVPCRHCSALIELRWPEGAAAPLPPRLVRPSRPPPRAPLPPPPSAPPPGPPRKSKAQRGAQVDDEDVEDPDTTPFVDVD
ncbi:MAG: zinc-ribbon domain-containing protein [Alphaproteobacteria bacterium]|nr:zinc-ribbon domain-containing protein [Alphaproteobacteria bacterium]MCB9690191.1 zinc-ribbon domain-containing protein [Alphaproteobacteria bacterium]